ncbi:MAG: 30S ribosomal protein S14 [Candidatus Diapherotrites archaeon]
MSEVDKHKKKVRKTYKKQCKRCGSYKGVISKYSIKLCRRCFKELAAQIGFEKYG